MAAICIPRQKCATWASSIIPSAANSRAVALLVAACSRRRALDANGAHRYAERRGIERRSSLLPKAVFEITQGDLQPLVQPYFRRPSKKALRLRDVRAALFRIVLR